MRITAVTGGVTMDVLVVPGAAADRVVGAHGDALRVRVAAPPERGRANDALRRVLAAALGVRTAQVTVTAGLTSRRKVVRVDGVTEADVRSKFAD